MRTQTFGLASLSIVTGFCLVQACGGDDDAGGAADPDAGGSTSSSSGATSSSGGSSSGATSSSGNTSSSGGTNDGGTEAGDGGDGGGAKSKMTFFVTSTGSGANGGNLGGLAGADTICKDLATKVGGGDHTWAAYLSTSKVDAKDRIGTGPWLNQKGTEIAKDVTALHMGNIKAADVLDENGKTVPNTGKYPTNVHDILTGTSSNGTKNGNTCKDWTSNDNNDDAQVGHSDAETTGNGGDRWNNAGHQSACDQAGLHATGGEGRIYCFAKD